jgi:hypothetical protein
VPRLSLDPILKYSQPAPTSYPNVLPSRTRLSPVTCPQSSLPQHSHRTCPVKSLSTITSPSSSLRLPLQTFPPFLSAHGFSADDFVSFAANIPLDSLRIVSVPYNRPQLLSKGMRNHALACQPSSLRRAFLSQENQKRECCVREGSRTNVYLRVTGLRLLGCKGLEGRDRNGALGDEYGLTGSLSG